MNGKNSRFEFFTLLFFLLTAILLLSNGFVARIFAQEGQVDVYQHIEPIGVVLGHVLEEHVYEPNLDKLAEGAIYGIMSSLDEHSSFISKDELEQVQIQTKGEFQGVGIQIKPNDEGQIMVFTPIKGSPAMEAGIKPLDIITHIDDIATEGMSIEDAADKIRGPRGTTVKLTILRYEGDNDKAVVKDFVLKRKRLPLESIVEARLLDNGIAYILISDFKDNTADDIRERLKEFGQQGMRALVLDLRWNPGGLLSASRQVSELFLPNHSLVTYTKMRGSEGDAPTEDDYVLYTERRPVIPADMPMVLLVNESSASASEIVTGALQYYKRAVVVGEKTHGKGSVQTIITLSRPEESALRLTTALYYTPAGVTINKQGILPDIEVVMEEEEEKLLYIQMRNTYKDDPNLVHKQNHGSVTGNDVIQIVEETPEEAALIAQVGETFGGRAAELLQEFAEAKRKMDSTIEDLQLMKAVELLQAASNTGELIQKYHRDVQETQMAAETASALAEAEALAVAVKEEENAKTH